MKIAIVHHNLATKGGAENLIIWFSKKLLAKGHEIEIFTARFNPSLWTDNSNNDLLVHVNPMFGDIYFLSLVFRRNLISELSNFDIVNVHNLNPAFTIALASKTFRKLRTVWYCHEPPRVLYPNIIEGDKASFEVSRSFFHDLLMFMDKIGRETTFTIQRHYDRIFVSSVNNILCNSNFTKTLVKKVYGRRSVISHPGIDVNRFSGKKTDIKESLRCNKLILSIGFLRHLKNFDILIRAMQLVKNKLSDVKCLIIGKGPEKIRLLRLVKDLKLDKYVIFKNFISDRHLPNVYASADTVIYIPTNEPFGLVPLEAMASRTPVIASNHGGPSETVIHGKTGVLVNPKNPIEVANAITRLLTNEHLMKRMGEEGRKHVEKNFSLDHAVESFEKNLLN